MSDDLVIGLTFLAPTLLMFVIVLIRSIDKHRPQYDDDLPRRQRRVTRNGFKSRMGVN